MAQNITIAGAQYSTVPSIDVPKTGGGTARFVDSSDADAAASDIISGKTAYVNGSKVTGNYVPPTGSYKVQTGEFVSTSTSNKDISITGLPFKPIGFSLVKQTSNKTSNNLCCLSSVSIYSEGGNPSYGVKMSGTAASFNTVTTFDLTWNNDGFTVHFGINCFPYGRFSYVVWG